LTETQLLCGKIFFTAKDARDAKKKQLRLLFDVYYFPSEALPYICVKKYKTNFFPDYSISSMYRFVILHHQTQTKDHWDVMLETDSALTTWSIPPQCLSGSSFVCQATPLPAHRKIYLDYEGEVAGNRGTVSRIDTGNYEPESFNTFLLHGKRFLGKLTLENDKMRFDATVAMTPRS